MFTNVIISHNHTLMCFICKTSLVSFCGPKIKDLAAVNWYISHICYFCCKNEYFSTLIAGLRKVFSKKFTCKKLLCFLFVKSCIIIHLWCMFGHEWKFAFCLLKARHIPHKTKTSTNDRSKLDQSDTFLLTSWKEVLA